MCICEDFYAYAHDEQGPAPGHSFVKYPEGVDPGYDDAHEYERDQYCEKHAPAGSVPYHGFY